MATIRTAIQLYDGAVNNAINTMRTASSRCIDTSAFQEACEQQERMVRGFQDIGQSIRDADHQQQKFNHSIRDTVMDSLKTLVQLSDSMTSTHARLTMVVEDGGSVEELEAKIMASAMRSRSYYIDTANAVADLGSNARNAFTGMDEVIAFSELVNKSFVLDGASQQEQAAAMLQLTQAMSSGVLEGKEFNAIFEQAPGIIQNIADYLDVPIGKIQEMASEGGITSDIVKNAMFAAADEINTKFESMPMTWGQIFTQAKNIVLKALQPILKGINWLANHISIIIPAVLGLAGAFAVFQIAAHWATIAEIATGLYTGAVNLLTIGFGILTGNTAAASAAVLHFNSAMLANPIVWVVMLIAVLIGALYAGVAAYNKFTGAGVSATGIIGGAFATLGAHLLNMFIIPLQNYFASLANFLGNVFHSPISAVKVLFYDMCLIVLGYIRNLAFGIEDLLNKIPGVTVDITSGLDNFYSGLQEAQQKVKDEAGWVEYVQKMDFIDYSDAAQAGYKFGESLVDKMSEKFGFGGSFDDLFSNTSDIAANTAASAEALEYTEEDLKYMKDLAEREVVNRFTTAEIKIEQVNHNNISSNMDIDGMVDKLTNGVNEAMEKAAEGVHE